MVGQKFLDLDHQSSSQNVNTHSPFWLDLYWFGYLLPEITAKKKSVNTECSAFVGNNGRCDSSKKYHSAVYSAFKNFACASLSLDCEHISSI